MILPGVGADQPAQTDIGERFVLGMDCRHFHYSMCDGFPFQSVTTDCALRSAIPFRSHGPNGGIFRLGQQRGEVFFGL